MPRPRPCSRRLTTSSVVDVDVATRSVDAAATELQFPDIGIERQDALELQLVEGDITGYSAAGRLVHGKESLACGLCQLIVRNFLQRLRITGQHDHGGHHDGEDFHGPASLLSYYFF
jgi:hypothetical protein